MPLKVYKCIKCLEETEKLFLSIKEADGVLSINCPKCGEFAYKIIAKSNFLGPKGKGNW